MPLMSMPRIAAATVSASSGLDGELHAAGLAAAADEDLGLDHDRAGAVGEEPLGGGARLGDGVGDLPGGDRQALGDEQRLGVGFLDLHAGDGSSGRAGSGWEAMVPRRAAARRTISERTGGAPRHTHRARPRRPRHRRGA